MKASNPLFNKQIRYLLIEFIFNGIQEKMDQKLLSIMNSHALTCPNKSASFCYKGQYYSPSGLRPVRGVRPSLLSKRLYEPMEQWLKESETLAAEIHAAENYLTCVLMEQKTNADLFALLPECLHSPLHFLKLNLGETTVSLEKAESINQIHQKSIQRIKERLVLNMIT